jgi:phage-related baseplate assembly protein
MAKLQNIWVSYLERTYQQIIDRILNKLGSRVPEITDHTDTNIFVRMLGVWAGIAEQLGYYIDNWGMESFNSTRRLYPSAVRIAQQYDYKIMSMLPASADITFYLDKASPTSIIIPQGTVIKHKEDSKIIFYTVQPALIAFGNLEVTVSAIQQELIEDVTVGLSDGSKNQTFVLPYDVANGTVSVMVQGDMWEHKRTLGFSKKTAKHFTTSVDEDKNPVLEFGDDVAGMIPVNGGEIVVSYYKTLGPIGNVTANTLSVLESSISLPDGVKLAVKNRQKSSGGADIESIEDLQRRIPLSIRTLNVAVTANNFPDIANQAAGVMKSAISYTCGKVVKIFIVPTDGGIASEILCQSVVGWFEDKKLFNTSVQCYPAGELTIYIKIKVVAHRNYQNEAVKQNVLSAILNFNSWQNQEIKGDIHVSDLYQAVEAAEGVKSSSIEEIKVIPYARPIDHFVPLNWDKTIKNTGNVINKWAVVFTSASEYQVYKGGNFKGTFNVGVITDEPEIQFVITSGAYTAGLRYEFFTYPNPYPDLGVPQINEFSVLISTPESLSLKVEGGIQ